MNNVFLAVAISILVSKICVEFTFYLGFFFTKIFNINCYRSNNSNGKDGWPTLSGHGKLANGLSEERKSPPLLDYLDQEVITSDGLDTELGQHTALSPFSSNCDSNR